MFKSILKRIGYMLIVIWVVSVMAFVLMRCAPGDPTVTMLPDTATDIQRAALRLSLIHIFARPLGQLRKIHGIVFRTVGVCVDAGF